MVSPLLFVAGRRLSLAELTAARLDGDVVEVGEAFMPADAVETAELRAGSLAPLIGPGLAAVRLSAAWVHGGILVAPRRHAVQRMTPSRAVTSSTPRFVYHDTLLPAHDVAVLSGGRVTTPARTLADLARSDDPEQLAAARGLVEARRGIAAEALDWLDRWRGMPGAPRARERIAALARRVRTR